MRNELEKRLRKKRSEVETIDREIASLKVNKGTHLAVIAELEALLRLVPKCGNDAKPERHLRVGSDVFNAREALVLERNPLHIKDLIEKIGGDDNRSRRSSLAAQLTQYARKEEVFTKNGPNIYGLIDYGPELVTPEQAAKYEAVMDMEEPERPEPDVDDDLPF